MVICPFQIKLLPFSLFLFNKKVAKKGKSITAILNSHQNTKGTFAGHDYSS